MESCWDYKGSKDKICEELRRRGFRESQAFTDLITS